jgi:hypothetical protein
LLRCESLQKLWLRAYSLAFTEVDDVDLVSSSVVIARTFPAMIFGGSIAMRSGDTTV